MIFKTMNWKSIRTDTIFLLIGFMSIFFYNKINDISNLSNLRFMISTAIIILAIPLFHSKNDETEVYGNKSAIYLFLLLAILQQSLIFILNQYFGLNNVTVNTFNIFYIRLLHLIITATLSISYFFKIKIENFNWSIRFKEILLIFIIYIFYKYIIEGIHYSTGILIGRGVTILVSVLILKTAMNSYQFFHEISKNDIVFKENVVKKNKLFIRINDLLLRCGLYEFTIYLADIKDWHLIILMFFMLLSFFFDVTFINIILFFIPMAIITKLILYGKETKLGELVKSTEYYYKQIYVSWISGIIILLFSNILVVIRYLLLSDYMAIYVLISGCSIISVFSILIGELTKNENLIQIAYLLLLYIMMDGNVFVLDFTGRSSSFWNFNILINYVIISLVAVMLLTIRRKLLIGRNCGGFK